MPRLPFLDWMKAIGMFLIVFGHVVGGQVNLVTPPIYHKQWGVTFFLFATGFTLARETRPTWRVALNRVFELLLIGGLFAAVTTVVSIALGGRGHLSNYWPFLLGANVLNNHFPANPTTWYIGTYLHVILLWTLLRQRLRVRPWWIAVAVAVEIATRALLWDAAGGFVAYQALPNWITVLLLGLYVGQRADDWTPPQWATPVAMVAALTPLVLGVLIGFDADFPFRRLHVAGAASSLVTSACVTALYSGVTWLMYRWSRPWRASASVEFLAAQTVFIFVAHMPLYYALLEWMGDWPRWVRAVPLVVLCYLALAVVGAGVTRVLRPLALREAMATRLAGRAAPARVVSS